jgi:N-acetylglucosaminyl-diphospho-decaprenol L-rhamnosyltransferase
MTPELSIAIVLYNSAEALEDCLHSLRPLIEDGFAEVIAVDNASPDDSVEILLSELPQAKLIQLDQNRGFAAGANAGLARATGNYFLLLNPDVSSTPDALRALVAFMDRHAELGIASPDIRGADGHWESPGRASPSVSRALLELSRVHRLLPRKVRGRILRGPYWLGGDQLDAGWIPATAAIVRPKAAREVGPLREDLFMYGEDLEWCWRMRRAGWRVGVCAAAEVVHATSSSAGRTFGEVEREWRIAAGIDRAYRVMYGAWRARALSAATALALALESAAPGRNRAHRGHMLTLARHWGDLALRR